MRRATSGALARVQENQTVTRFANLRRWRTRVALTLVVALATPSFLQSRSVIRAAEPYGNSLDWAPADAAIYSASLRLKEQVDIVAASNAWKKFRQIPSVAMAWQMAEAQINNPEGPAAMFWQLMELPENKQLVKLLGEMFSDEIVFYAGNDFIKFIELMQVIQGSRLAPLFEAFGDMQPAPLGGPMAIGERSSQARLQMVLEAIREDPDLLNVPQLVFAFRIEDRDAVTTQLNRLELLANQMLDQTDLGAKFERRTIGQAECIVLALDGSMIPWEQMTPLDPIIDEETFEDLKRIISGKQLFLAVGAWNDYVVLSVGRSTEHLAKLGDGPAIGEREELAPLAQHRNRKLVAASYVSREVAASQQILAEDLDDVVAMVEEIVREIEEAPEAMITRLAADARELADDLKPYATKPGPRGAFQFLTDSGFEGYAYDWTEWPGFDSSKPLGIVDHLGGSPIIAFASRGTPDQGLYDLLAKWSAKAVGYFEDFALPEMDEDERAEAEQALAIVKPLAARFDKVTREKLIPAMQDGQSAIVFDADITSKQWHTEMPSSFTPLPMAELAIVMGINDRDAFLQAMAEYRDMINDAIDAVREQHPDDVPAGLAFPTPTISDSPSGTLYAWKLNPVLELNEQLVPCGAVNDSLAAIATSRALAERVMAEHPLAPAEGALGNGDQPRVTVAGIDFAALIEAIAPWVEYGIRMHGPGAMGASEDPAGDPAQVQSICSQVRMGLEILQCFRGAWSESHMDGDVWVTHSVITFKDLE
jgi:hypothetical protein